MLEIAWFFCVLYLKNHNCHFYTMKINDWFTNGCNYEEGVAIYASLKTSKINLLRLFQKKNASTYLEKLKYELGKHKETEVVLNNFTVVSPGEKPTSAPAPIITPIIEPPLYKQKLIRDYPVALHPVYIQQKNDYATACSLKIQLNNVDGRKRFDGEALKLCLEIERLFDAVELAWKQLDHYTETNTILVVKEHDFSDLTPGQLILKRNSKRSSLTKAKRLVANYKAALLKPQTIAQKTRIEVKKEKLISIPDEVLLKYISEEEIAVLKEKGTGIYSITVVGVK